MMRGVVAFVLPRFGSSILDPPLLVGWKGESWYMGLVHAGFC